MYLLSKGFCHYFEQYPSLVKPANRYRKMEVDDKDTDFSQAYSEAEPEWNKDKKNLKTKRKLF